MHETFEEIGKYNYTISQLTYLACIQESKPGYLPDLKSIISSSVVLGSKVANAQISTTGQTIFEIAQDFKRHGNIL